MAVPAKVARKFSRSIQNDSLALRRRIARAQRAAYVRKSAHWPARSAA